jgi:hypothetical protein
MVERVARALCSYPFDLYERLEDVPGNGTDRALLLAQMESWRVMARAAIEAMGIDLPASTTCDQCGKSFTRGQGGDRRSIAKFCSEKCKNRFHYVRRCK